MSKLIDLIKKEDRKAVKDFKVTIDKEKIDKIDPEMIKALMNVTVVPVSRESESSEKRDVVEDLFDAIINDASIVTSMKEEKEVQVEKDVLEKKPRVEKPKVITNPPITSPESINKASDLSVLDPNLKNETITDNMLVDNSIVIILQAKIKLLKKKGVERDILVELEELLSCMEGGNKIAMAQRWQHIATLASSRGLLETRAFLQLIGELYFTEEKIF